MTVIKLEGQLKSKNVENCNALLSVPKPKIIVSQITVNKIKQQSKNNINKKSLHYVFLPAMNPLIMQIFIYF